MSVDIQVKGLREVEQMLRDLQGPKASRALRASMLKASQPIVDAAKVNAPVGSGALRESISRWFVIDGKGSFLGIELPSLGGGTYRVKVGPVVGNKTAIALYNLAYKRRRRPRRGIFYGHFYEFGARNVSKRAFLTPALKSKSDEAIRLFTSTLRASIERIAKRKK